MKQRARFCTAGALALCAALGVGCSGGDATSDATGDAAASGPEFSPCPLRVTQPFTAPHTGHWTVNGFDGKYSPVAEWLSYSNGIDAMSSAMAECATVQMPAVWSDPEGDSIDLFVKRYPAAVQPAKGQLWILEGGPGRPGSFMEHLAFLIAPSVPTLDIYLPDHRGTGKSTLADCPGTPPQSAECAATVPHLDGLTTTGAAQDLAALIDATRTGSQQVFVYGLSYGTYLAQRYLQIRPDQPTAVILDSTVPVGLDFASFDKGYDDKARAVLALCQADAACSAKLGPDPLAKAEEALATDAATCPYTSGLQLFLGGLVGGDYFDRLLLPASIYRVLRCTAADRAWFEQVRAYREWQSGLFTQGFSEVVGTNIVVSELWHSSATAAAIVAEETATMIVSPLTSALYASAASTWPKYPLDEHSGKWPSSPAPTLVLQGGLDARTPYGDIVKARYSGKNQHYVEMPNAVHVLAWPESSPMADLTAPGCGWQVIQGFLADPAKPPDTSCIAGMAPIDFGSPPPEWMALVGIQDLWE